MSHKCGQACRRKNGKPKCDTCRGRPRSTGGEGQLTTIIRVRPAVNLLAKPKGGVNV